MSQEKKEITIGESKYIVKQFGAKKGQKVLLKLLSLVAPIMLGFIGKDIKDLKNQDLENAPILNENQMLGQLAQTMLDPRFADQTDELITSLMECVYFEHDGLEVEVLKAYDKVFQNKYNHIIKLSIEVVTHNGFFEQLEELMGEDLVVNLAFQMT